MTEFFYIWILTYLELFLNKKHLHFEILCFSGKKTMHLPVKICGVINSVTQPLPDFYMSHRTIKVFSLISGLETGTWFEG